MRGRLKIWFFMAVLALVASCTKDEYNEDNDLNKRLVVEAYVYANEPVNHVKVSKVHNEGQANPLPLSTAQVWVRKDSILFQLVPHPQEAGMYIQEDTNIVPSGLEGPVELSITYDGHEHFSTTNMPAQIQGLTISSDIIDVVPGDTTSVVATISWNEMENASGYCIFIRNIGENAQPISGYAPDVSNKNPFVIVNHSTQIELNGADFSHFGTYEVYVTAVNREYVEIYDNPSDGNLNATPTNIDDGWGVFTAFNGQTLTFTVQ